MSKTKRIRKKDISKKVAELAKYPAFAKDGFTMPAVEEIFRRVRLSVSECYKIFSHAKRIPNNGTYLEIGSWLGGSALCASLGARMAKNSIDLIAIDWGIDETLFREITRLIPDIKLLVLSSNIAKDKIENDLVDLCFIDGDHHYKQVKLDFFNYWPKIKIGGILLGHDYGVSGWPGVKKAADEIFAGRVTQLTGTRIFKVIKTTKELK